MTPQLLNSISHPDAGVNSGNGSELHTHILGGSGRKPACIFYTAVKLNGSWELGLFLPNYRTRARSRAHIFAKANEFFHRLKCTHTRAHLGSIRLLLIVVIIIIIKKATLPEDNLRSHTYTQKKDHRPKVWEFCKF